MLQSIRGATGGIILKIFMGLIVLSFGVWGIGDFLHPSSSNVAATVGDVSISNARLTEEVRRQTGQLSQMFGGQVPEQMLQAMNIDGMILKQMVQEELLKQGAENLGLRVDDSVITRLIAANPTFRNEEGKFDRERFRQALWSIGQDEKGYIENLKQNLSVMFLVQAVTAETSVTDIKIKTLHAIEGQKRIAEYIRILPSAVTVPAQPEETELRAFYEEAKGDFASPETRKVSYVAFSKKDAGKNASTDDLYILANKVEDALAGGSRLEEIAKSLNLRLAQVEDLKASSEGKQLPDGENFVHQAFQVEQGNESGLILSQDQNTYYVLRVDAVRPVAEQKLAKVRDKVIAAWKDEAQGRFMKAMAEDIVTRMAKGEKLQSIASKKNLKLERSGAVGRNGGNGNAGLAEEFVHQLFQTSKGMVKGVYALDKGKGYMVGQLAEVIKAPPLSEKEKAALREQMREGMFDDLLAQYTLYLQQKIPVEIMSRPRREVE